jgi:hypothetical protein
MNALRPNSYPVFPSVTFFVADSTGRQQPHRSAIRRGNQNLYLEVHTGKTPENRLQVIPVHIGNRSAEELADLVAGLNPEEKQILILKINESFNGCGE